MILKLDHMPMTPAERIANETRKATERIAAALEAHDKEREREERDH